MNDDFNSVTIGFPRNPIFILSPVEARTRYAFPLFLVAALHFLKMNLERWRHTDQNIFCWRMNAIVIEKYLGRYSFITNFEPTKSWQFALCMLEHGEVDIDGSLVVANWLERDRTVRVMVTATSCT
ncbi:hypothetical protein M8C21_010493, partial [Ambrosia artemisiifolia]